MTTFPFDVNTDIDFTDEEETTMLQLDISNEEDQ